MKRSILLSVIAAVAASCTVQEADVLIDEETSPVFYASFEKPEEQDTKVYANEQLLLRWHEDDRVSIFEKLTYNQQYQFMGKTGDNSGNFQKVEGDGYVTGNTINDIVAVYPYQQGTSIAEDEVLSVEFPAEQVYAQSSFGRGANTMISVSSDNMLMFKNVGAYLMFSLYGEDVSVSSITLRGNNNEKLSGKAYVTMPLNGLPSTQVVGDATDASSAITLRCESPVALGASESECTEFWFVVPPVTFSRGFTITITQATGGTVEKSTSNAITLTRNKLSKMAPMEVEKAALPEHEMVDLGLPSGLKWATCNVGASAPEEYGDYFAWGEAEPKSDYSWETYKFRVSGEWDNAKINKYCTKSSNWGGTGPMDNKTVLDPEDDAARVNWGGSWRMPTLADWQELRNKCTWTWTSQSGVNGRQVTGPSGKSIFLPAAGYRSGTDLSDAGARGIYWSSSLNTGRPYSYCVDFNSDYYNWSNGYRCDGFSIRPVNGEFIPVSSISLEPSSLELKEGESYTLSATISPSNATEKTVHWVSSDESVAVVDANGLVTAAGVGTVTITAYGSSGVSAECIVIVEDIDLYAKAAPECKSGDVLLATNPHVEKFLQEVSYPDKDLSFTRILDYYGGFNGKTYDENGLEDPNGVAFTWGKQPNSDKPQSYSIRWKKEDLVEGSSMIFTLSDQLGWTATAEVAEGACYVNFTNLVPNDAYTYKVTAIATGKVIAEGGFTTTGSLHQVFFSSSCRNARDLGGWKTLEGKTVKFRKVYRGGRMVSETVNSRGRTEILAEGIGAQLDLRGSDRLTTPTVAGLDFLAPGIEQGGKVMLIDEREKVLACFEFIVNSLRSGKSVYFHCAMGRDRTGTLAALLLGLLGVRDGDVSQEYELTYFAPVGYSVSSSEKSMNPEPIFLNTRNRWVYSDIQPYFWDLSTDGTFASGVENYLVNVAGVRQQDIDDFRSLMLE